MAGYIFALKSKNKKEIEIKKVLTEIIESGVYSTNMEIKKDKWNIPQEGTFADYLSMKEGDNVYFFIDRKIYGVGKLVKVEGECKHLNFPGADLPKTESYTTLKSKMILNASEEFLNNRFICTFEPSPYFFEEGIDMDDVLASNPSAFKMLRVFANLSFIKIDEIENKALLDVILKRNEKEIVNAENIFGVSSKIHNRIKQLHNEDYKASSKNILKLAADGQLIKHEMAIEAGVIDYIVNNSKCIFGNWDYISHQVVASPFKPVFYVDKMDIFGYKYIPNFNTISKYLMIEIKKDIANEEVIHQAMKYVDWINQEYSFGDYNMIEAFIVASDFPNEVIELRNEVGKRAFIQGRRPPITDEWTKLKLIKYVYDEQTKNLEFHEVK
ncbi:hypothetical protein FOH38_03515 [Lysinibacillus fusiformis]|nr:hypothetical protein FOH38_03515 [Lysinibacillus fusiformis]